ncbi:putative phage tail protein [uncultured Megasphaera sp.]|uniref:putative phage tail protein n=1 Tax=uncultured Megasphaera sp. TaxID=165188 RepID=UPI0025CCB9F8|nr:putative phage tail protein [uncultured Megasphaera sp.]
MSANEWMRQHPIDVLDYLPKFLGQDPMFKKTADTCSTEHNRLRLALQDLADNFFVNTATWALPLYESFLGIKPGDGDTDEFRRQRILFKLQHVDVSTVDFMNSIVNLYSVGHIEEVNEEYYFKVYCIMNDKDTGTLSKLIAQLDIYKPAHLGYSWNGKIHWDGEATFSTATIVSGKGVTASG